MKTDFILRNRAGYPEEIWRESYQRSRIQLHRLMIEKKNAKDQESSSSSDEDLMANDHALKTIAKDVEERLDDGLLPDSPEETDIISGMGSLSEGYVGAFITEFKHGLNNFNNPIRYFNEGLSNDKTTNVLYLYNCIDLNNLIYQRSKKFWSIFIITVTWSPSTS